MCWQTEGFSFSWPPGVQAYQASGPQWSHKPLQPAQGALEVPIPLGRSWGWEELSLHTPRPAGQGVLCLALPRPHLEHISPHTQLAGGGYIFHGERGRETALLEE